MTQWRKAKRSGTGAQSNCVEVANLSGNIGMRDSKNPSGPHITLPAERFRELAAAIKRGAHDVP
ncbi:uncharacterized protein DUF397 [Actinomadura hallensis]|jgi:hypothetical protein|uniref:Uncharacterized protein DUF397 n=1 Tax=Actinomadura hallensis TaxID=337895 RepID=A0A543IL12_9ACTN|nr:DUF397 domain-containing protein [Actinomadura hallensis]TQM71266.1 uncharacterized protein DUF397 [Actinomadura hallensis]